MDRDRDNMEDAQQIVDALKTVSPRVYVAIMQKVKAIE